MANHSRVAAEPGHSPWEEGLEESVVCWRDPEHLVGLEKKKAVVGMLASNSLHRGKARGEAGEEVAAVWVNVWQQCLPSQVPNGEHGWSTARLSRAKCSHPTARCIWPMCLLQPCVGILTLVPPPPPTPQLWSPCAWGSQVQDAGMLLPARELHPPSGFEELAMLSPLADGLLKASQDQSWCWKTVGRDR